MLRRQHARARTQAGGRLQPPVYTSPLTTPRSRRWANGPPAHEGSPPTLPQSVRCGRMSRRAPNSVSRAGALCAPAVCATNLGDTARRPQVRLHRNKANIVLHARHMSDIDKVPPAPGVDQPQSVGGDAPLPRPHAHRPSGGADEANIIQAKRARGPIPRTTHAPHIRWAPAPRQR